MVKHYIGIDNGVTGSVCILDEAGTLIHYGPTPVFKSLNYTKAVGYSQRVAGDKLYDLLKPYASTATLLLERPMINPLRWKASISAVRCDEGTRIVLEMLGIRFQYVDSREWQKVMLPQRPAVPRLPKGASNDERKKTQARRAAFAKETKDLSLSVGLRLFPQINAKGDADAALMAEFARREKL